MVGLSYFMTNSIENLRLTVAIFCQGLQDSTVLWFYFDVWVNEGALVFLSGERDSLFFFEGSLDSSEIVLMKSVVVPVQDGADVSVEAARNISIEFVILG